MTTAEQTLESVAETAAQGNPVKRHAKKKPHEITSFSFAPEAKAPAPVDPVRALLDRKSFDISNVSNTLEALSKAREQWEENELAASHAKLYRILESCYRIYLAMNSDSFSKEARKKLKDGLTEFIKAQGLRTLGGTHGMNMVIKAVFGRDRRRVSAYALALRVALHAGPERSPISPDDLIDWIEKSGGVEEIRHASNPGAGEQRMQRLELAKEDLNSNCLWNVPAPKALRFDADDCDAMVLLVATYRPNGNLEISTVVKTDSVVKAAVAAHYKANENRFKEAKVTEKKQATAIELAISRTAAA